MSIIAGVVSRAPRAALPASVRAELRGALSRYPGETFIEFSDARAYLAKVDVGALGAPAACIESRAVSMLAGEPLLAREGGGSGGDRRSDLEVLHEAWGRGEWGPVARCRGMFCAARYDAGTAALALVADKLAARPLYYWVGSQYVAFASALRILESLDIVPKEMDLRGVTETACFGYALGARTAYAGISALRAGEVVQVTQQAVERSRYWRWDNLADRSEARGQLSQLLHQRFKEAVARRKGADLAVAAFLSGGLDSRVIVSALRSLGATVHTLNFAPPDTQDRVFGAAAAAALGTLHQELPMQPERFEETVRRARARWEGSAPWAAAPPERPRVVWSGDGGSVGLGGVMLNRATVERARHRDFEGAAAEFLRFNKLGIPRRLMRKGLADALAALPRKGVRDELEVLECADPGRAPHLFLMLHNETRRYAERYEDIDLHRTEFQVPFLDTDFLEAVFAAPIDRLLGHEQYMEWLACFPREVTAVPWQAYPGHAACPLPVAAEMRYQWGPRFYDAATEAALKRTIQRQADAALRARDFPQSIIDRRRLRIAAWLTRLGVRDYGYAIECAATYCRYWQGCDGRCDDPLLKH